MEFGKAFMFKAQRKPVKWRIILMVPKFKRSDTEFWISKIVNFDKKRGKLRENS